MKGKRRRQRYGEEGRKETKGKGESRARKSRGGKTETEGEKEEIIS